MAKMFYSLEEAASKLGKSTDEIQAMADSGQLSAFRDGDKIMFKRDQVDGLASDGGDEIDLLEDDSRVNLSPAGGGDAAADSAEATGISVFDADEVNNVDAMAATQVTNSPVNDEDLALESVGSGSGLLDLTRETDDTSLGAELLDEIYPSSSPDSQEIKMDTAAIGSTGIFDHDVSGPGADAYDETNEFDTTGTDSMEDGESEISFGDSTPVAQAMDDSIAETDGFDDDFDEDRQSEATPAAMQMQQTRSYAEAYEDYDKAGSTMGGIFMAGALISLILGLWSILPAWSGVRGKITDTFLAFVKEGADGINSKTLLICGILLGVSVLAGTISFFMLRPKNN